MKIENKICFFLNSSREIDMYLNIYKEFPKNQIFFLINDSNKNTDLFKKDIIKIESFLNKKNLNYDFLSKLHRKKKFSLIVSTADLSVKKFKLKSFLKYLYAKSFGILIQYFGLKTFFKIKFNKDFTAGGNKAEFLERILSRKNCKKNN